MTFRSALRVVVQGVFPAKPAKQLEAHLINAADSFLAASQLSTGENTADPKMMARLWLHLLESREANPNMSMDQMTAIFEALCKGTGVNHVRARDAALRAAQQTVSARSARRLAIPAKPA